MRWSILVVAIVGCGDRSSDTLVPDAPADAPACNAARPPVTGKGTYYAADGTGSCSFNASTDHLVAAINAPDYAIASWCGACLAVTGPAGEVIVRVVDKCPGCAHGDLDLSSEAFAMISPLSAGRVPITWHEVTCDVQGPISYQFKNGSNAFWTAIQIRNHRYPIAKVEAQNRGGTYEPIARVDYNYFVDTSGLGAGPYTLRVTDTRGHAIEDTSVALGSNVVRQGASQFPACP